MERYQVGGPGLGDFFIHPEHHKGLMVSDDMILKKLEIDEKGAISCPGYIESSTEYFCIDGSVNNSRIVYAGDDNQVFSCSLDDIEKATVFTEFKGKVQDIALTHGGHRVCIVGMDKDAVIFDFDHQKKLSTASTSDCSLISCAWSPDGTTFAVVGRNGVLTLYLINNDFLEIKMLHHWKISEKDIKDDYLHGINPQFVGTNKIIVAGKDCLQMITKHSDGTWNYSISSRIKHQERIYMVAALRDNFIATVGEDHKICIWNMALDLKLKQYDISYKCFRIRFLPRNDILAIQDDEGQIFTATGVVSGTVATVFEEPDFEDSKPSVAKSIIESVNLQIKSEKGSEAPQGNTMDIEHKNDGMKSPAQENEDSNFVADYDQNKIGFDSYSKRKNQNLVYDEAEEEEMKKHAGVMDEENPVNDILPVRKRGADRKVETKMQQPFMPGSTITENRRYLCHNMFGKVGYRKEASGPVLDVEYSDNSLPKSCFKNNFNYTMASINYKGVLLASEGVVIMEDDYVDETVEEDQKRSTVFFSSSNGKKTWSVKLNERENATSVALGSHWAAVYTNKKIIRIFSPEGLEVSMISFHNPMIGMCFYENLLAVVYHSTHPFSGNQYTRVQIINMSSKEIVLDNAITLSNDGQLNWYGFSEEGIFYVQDTKYMIWGQQSQHLWTPVYDGGKERNMWVLGITEHMIVSIRLPYGEHQPGYGVNYVLQQIAFRPPFASSESNSKDAFLKTLKHEQEKLRYSYFGHMRRNEVFGDIVTFDDPMTSFRSTIKSEEELDKLRFEADKAYTQLARVAALKDDQEAAIFYGLQLESPKSLEICLKMFESMKKPKLAEMLKQEADKLGALQFKYRTGSDRVYVPQLLLADNEVDFILSKVKVDGNRTQTLAIIDNQTIAFNSMKMNKSSFNDVLNEGAHETENLPGKSKPSVSIKSSLDEEKPKKKFSTSTDLFRDLSDITKYKR